MDETNKVPVGTVPKLADVARVAGVSTATVSRCLNLPDQVKEKTMRKVMDAIDSLGYSPNYSARALAANRTNTVGAIIPTMDNAIFARGIQAFQEELHKSGCTLLVASSSYEEDLEEEQIRTLTARGADALLLIGYHRQPRVYEFLKKRRIPALVAWAYNPDQPQLAVGFNNHAAMKSLAREVLERGHRKIACITAPTGSNDRARDRVLGVKEGLRDAGLDPDGLTIIETNYSIENGAQAFQELMTLDERPTAVMCGNDVLAVGALKAATEMGLKIPDDVSITGFDDIELASVAPVPLTTVHVPHRRMGQFAAQALIETLDSGQTGESHELPTNICFRGTLAPPPEK
ncbi:MAG: LacI family DNA-binding transcriptional regulator [Roseibium sp.]|uniref:LacI family DNA-binding transcriptional regulator n=1 Tax=Roseibium sp. TaxID=1936156 RepID=UPI001AFCF195|nr:LacI family DNA-binding transcriptional regulator [Roseibium sp.]MBO6892707.1 LacI family DNA-binding transcriptional regulator [Roseibium sp.]MBO6928946.1 LacI family DNA-binding transcriptional regulator [Roseibium sp.]